jgi:hypothetical protein
MDSVDHKFRSATVKSVKSVVHFFPFAFNKYLVGVVPGRNSIGREPKTSPSVLQNNNYGIIKWRVIEHKSHNKNPLHWVQCGITEKGSDWLVFRPGLKSRKSKREYVFIHFEDV